MDILTDKKDQELKNRIKEKYSIHETAGKRFRADSEDGVKFYWPYEVTSYENLVEKTSDFLKSINFDEVYAVAWKEEQYIEYEENFMEKYNNKSVKIDISELNEVSNDLIEFMVVHESLDWIIVFNHEGDIAFNGTQDFVEKVKEFFSNWEKLSESERRHKSFSEDS